MEKKVFNIDGMTCASCAQTVENSAKKLEGVEDASVNLATEKLNVQYDGSILTETDIKVQFQMQVTKQKLILLKRLLM